MKFFSRRKDGGSESTVTGYWFFEIKWLFSVVLLRFDGVSREAFHNHAFNCFSWVLSGELEENFLDGRVRHHRRRWLPFATLRSHFHMVHSITPRTWVLSFRGPWSKTWTEFLPDRREFVTLTGGRRELSRRQA